jgi:hypothetical protein
MSQRESKRDEKKISKFIPYDQQQELLLQQSVQEYILRKSYSTHGQPYY